MTKKGMTKKDTKMGMMKMDSISRVTIKMDLTKMVMTKKDTTKMGLTIGVFSIDGIHIDTKIAFDEDGFNKNGYDKDGFNKNGL